MDYIALSGDLVNDGLERIRKDAVVAYYRDIWLG
jgi:hypothetical protein